MTPDARAKMTYDAPPAVPDVQAHQSRTRAEEPSLGELFSNLLNDATSLVKQEVNLAKAEMSQKISQVGRDVASLAIGAGVALFAAQALLFALIYGLNALGVPLWASALVVGLVFGGVGAFLVMRGVNNLKRFDPVPHQTVETLKEDTQWIREQTK